MEKKQNEKGIDSSLRPTEQDSNWQDLEKMETADILKAISAEDRKVAEIVASSISEISLMAEHTAGLMKAGGRLFYIGSGTSGRLGIVDASECPPTFGIADNLVIGIIAGGDKAIRKAQEFAEDDMEQAWKDLQKYKVNQKDIVLGLTSSGSTPYVLGALKKCRDAGIATACLCCNPNSPAAHFSDFVIEVVTGPEFLTGSTRMKAGTAQKMVLNMISTSVMIRLGRVKGNKMVDMQLSNHKLIERGIKMIVNLTGLTADKAKKELLATGSVRKALNEILKTQQKK